MNWDALYAGFRDELAKIAEVNLRGLSAETLRSYPQPQPMPSEAYEKAQAILARVQPQAQPAEKVACDERIPPKKKVPPILMSGGSVLGVDETEKTADITAPDQMPQIKRLFRRRNKSEEPPPSKVDSALSYGGHTLAGAGVGKFVHGATEGAVQMRRKGLERFYKLDPKWQTAAIGTGAALGLANKVRKEVRRKRWQKGKHP